MPLIIIQSKMPCISGRMPTDFSVLGVSDAPIKNKDNVMNCLASLLMVSPMCPPIEAAVSPIKAELLSM